jgi:hypothetical protein
LANFDAKANFGFGLVSIAPSPATTGTTFSMTNADAELMPDPSVANYNLTIGPSNKRPMGANAEIIRVTAKSAPDSGGQGHTRFTIVRQQEGTSARSISIGDFAGNNITKKWFDDIENAITQKTLITVGRSAGADYVCDGTADNVEIQAAINAVSAAGGGTVQVKVGTYNIASNINMASNVSLVGSGKGTMFVMAINTTVKIDAKTNASVEAIGFDGSAHSTTNNFCVYVQDSTDVLLARNYVTNANGFGFFITASASNTCSRITIRENYLQGKGNNDVIGGGAANSTGAVVSDVNIYGNNVVQDCTTNSYDNVLDIVKVLRVTVDNNIFRGRVQFGTEQFPNSNSKITNNILWPAINKTTSVLLVTTYGTATSPADGITISGNMIQSGGVKIVGISGQPVKHVTISGNTIKGETVLNGVELTYVSESAVTGNVITNTTAGVAMTSCADMLIDSNQFSSSSYGIRDLTGVASILIGTNSFKSISIANIVGGTLASEATRTATKTVGTAGSGADYVCDGVADNVEIQAAINAVLGTGGTVLIKAGTYNINARLSFGAAGGGNIRLLGEGIDATTLQFQTGTTETYILVDNSNLSDVTIEGISFYANGQQNKGLIALQGGVTNVQIRYCSFSGIFCNIGGNNDRWPLKIGTIKLISGTITAVDATTDVLTVGANIPTGTPILFKNTGGVLPGGLSLTASYYAINVSATTIKVATTADNAYAGTPAVDLIDAGSGTNTVEAADYANSSSSGVIVEYNRFTNNNPNTFEIILAVNWRDSWVEHNYFSGNTLVASDEVSFYPHHENTVYAHNIHNNSNGASFGAKDSIGVRVHDNIFYYTTNSGEAVNMRDTINSEVYNNSFISDRTSGASRAVGIEDTSGPSAYDGWAPYVQATRGLVVRNNKVYNYKYGVEACLSPTNRDLDLKNVFIENNSLDSVEVPIRIGASDPKVDLKNWFITGNRITNWRGTLLGGIHVIGYTTDPTLVNQIYIRDNYVDSRLSSTSSGSIRSVGATITEVKDNILTTSGSYGAISTVNGGVFNKLVGNTGVMDTPQTGITVLSDTTLTLSDQTPTMTSAFAPSGVATASSEFDTNNPAWRSFDKTTTNKWTTASGLTTGWLRYDFPQGKVITQYTITGPISGQTTRGPKTWTFEASQDGNTWTVLDTQTNVATWTALLQRTYTFTNTTAYKSYRINVTANQGDATLLSFVGLKLMGLTTNAAIDPNGSAAFSKVYPTNVYDNGGAVFNVKSYGATGNTKVVLDGAMTATSNVLTSATANFTNDDVGKAITILGAGPQNTSGGGNGVTGVYTLQAYIVSVTNSTTVVISKTATNTVSGQRVIYGTNDKTAFDAAVAAASVNGGVVFVPGGRYRGDLIPLPLYLPSNVMLVGAGQGATIISMPVYFGNGVSGPTAPLIVNSQMRDFTLDGQHFPGNYNGIGYTNTQNCWVQDVTVVNVPFWTIIGGFATGTPWSPSLYFRRCVFDRGIYASNPMAQDMSAINFIYFCSMVDCEWRNNNNGYATLLYYICCKDIEIENIRFSNVAGANSAVNSSGGDNFTLRNATLLNNSDTAWYIRSKSLRINGVDAMGANALSSGLKVAIWCADGVIDNVKGSGRWNNGSFTNGSSITAHDSYVTQQMSENGVQSVSSGSSTLTFTTAPFEYANGLAVDIDAAGTVERRTIVSGANTTTWTLDSPLTNAHTAPFQIRAIYPGSTTIQNSHVSTVTMNIGDVNGGNISNSTTLRMYNCVITAAGDNYGYIGLPGDTNTLITSAFTFNVDFDGVLAQGGIGFGYYVPATNLITYVGSVKNTKIFGNQSNAWIPGGKINLAQNMQVKFENVDIYTGWQVNAGTVFNNGSVFRNIRNATTNAPIALPTGVGTTPSIPASNTPLTNNTGIDATVHIAGGTVTVVKVGSVTTGLTSPSTVRVPVGQTITLTYSVAPTWVWIAE